MGSSLGTIGSAVGSYFGGPIGGAIGGTIGSAIGGSDSGGGNPQAATQGGQQYNQNTQASTEWANNLNKDNALWALNQNQQAADRALGNNRVNQTSDFGSTSWNQDANGKWSQTNSIDPAQQAMLGSLRGQQGNMIDSMSSGFNVNGDVMNAYRGQQQPLIDQARDTENARLAAMGLGTGSGMAWGLSQDALNRSQNDADQKAILAGFSADQQLRSSNRADLAALNNTETGWKNNSLQPTFAQQGANTMGQITAAVPGNADLGQAANQDRAYQNAVAAAKASGNRALYDQLVKGGLQAYQASQGKPTTTPSAGGSGAADAAGWANMGSGAGGSGAGGWSSNSYNGQTNSSGWDWLPSFGSSNTSGMDW